MSSGVFATATTIIGIPFFFGVTRAYCAIHVFDLFKSEVRFSEVTFGAKLPFAIIVLFQS